MSIQSSCSPRASLFSLHGRVEYCDQVKHLLLQEWPDLVDLDLHRAVACEPIESDALPVALVYTIIEGDNRSKVDQPILGHVCLDQVTLGYTRRNVPDIFTSLSLGSEVGTDASDDGDSLADNSPAPVGMLTCVIIDRNRRKEGHGLALLKELERVSSTRYKLKALIFTCKKSLQRFYEHGGYFALEKLSAEVDDDGEPMIWMAKVLSR